MGRHNFILELVHFDFSWKYYFIVFILYISVYLGIVWIKNLEPYELAKK